MKEDLKDSINSSSNFLYRCFHDDEKFSLTPRTDSSIYSNIFGFLVANFIKVDLPDSFYMKLKNEIHQEILRKLQLFDNYEKLLLSKKDMQYICFGLSVLKVLDENILESLVNHFDNSFSFQKHNNKLHSMMTSGTAQTGNLSMFYAIVLIYLNNYQNKNYEHLIENWEKLHIDSMNHNGFWGDYKFMNHLQFQNGYHQYEIFSYRKTENINWDLAAESVYLTSSEDGRFSPYIGGGGCFDYDAIFILTKNKKLNEKFKELLIRTRNSILTDQNIDGGHCESRHIRPVNTNYLINGFNHWIFSPKGMKRERLRQYITLMRPKHNTVTTHWTKIHRYWEESDLWDTWFRIMTLAKIDISLGLSSEEEWGFIDFPGIGSF